MINVSNEELICLMETGYLNLAMGKFNEAKEIFEGVEMLVPESEAVQIALGNLYFDQGNLEEAEKAFQKAVFFNPQNSLSRVYLYKTLLTEGKKQEAIVGLKEIATHEKQEAVINMAKALLEAVGEEV